ADRRRARRPAGPALSAVGRLSRGGRNGMALPFGYLSATRHPWPCLWFVLPLLAAYEAGVLSLGGPHPETIRNGADHWLRYGLGAMGVRFFWVPPALLAV